MYFISQNNVMPSISQCGFIMVLWMMQLMPEKYTLVRNVFLIDRIPFHGTIDKKEVTHEQQRKMPVSAG